MKLTAILLVILVVLIGCGEGPKHLSKADYQRGKAAFELLEQYDHTLSVPFATAAEEQILTLDKESPAPLNLTLALTQYESAIGLRDLVRSEEGNIDEIAPLIKLCHDDAAQYFDATAASTNTCGYALDTYRTKHKMP